MPAPKDKGQLTPWLKAHGYKWVLQGPHSEIATVAQAITAIEQDEKNDRALEEIGNDPVILTGVYYSENCWDTGHILGFWHDDDTHEPETMITSDFSKEEKDGAMYFTFPDGVVLVQHDGMLELEWEYKGEPAPQKPAEQPQEKRHTAFFEKGQ